MHKRYRAIAEYYDAENEHYSMLQEDVPFFLSHLPRRRLSILELAVGTARAAIPLAQAGHRVVGVDYDPKMLALARRKRDSVGLTEEELSLRRADLLRFNLGRKFDRICIFFNTFLSFTTLPEQDRVLGSIRRHLKPGGRFWLDIFNPDLSLLAEPAHRNLDPCFFSVNGRTVQRLTDISRGSQPQVQHLTFKYSWYDAKGKAHRERTEFDLTYLMPRELQLLLERNGFKIEHLWGDYDGSELRPDSPRMIAECRQAPRP